MLFITIIEKIIFIGWEVSQKHLPRASDLHAKLFFFLHDFHVSFGFRGPGKATSDVHVPEICVGHPSRGHSQHSMNFSWERLRFKCRAFPSLLTIPWSTLSLYHQSQGLHIRLSFTTQPYLVVIFEPFSYQKATLDL